MKSERDRFVAGVTSRVGGAYCTPPRPGRCTDCSGLVAEEYEKATGRSITGGSHAQMTLGTTAGNDPRGWQPGDLLFYDTMGVTAGGNRASHVGVYIGADEAVHAMNPRQGIIRSRIASEYWTERFIGARRLFDGVGGRRSEVGRDAAGGRASEVEGEKSATVSETGSNRTSDFRPPTSDPMSPQSPFRDLGNTDRASFRAALSRSITDHPSPITPESEAIYDALAPLGLTRLGAAMAWIERSNETNPADLRYYGRDLHNAWAVKNPPADQAKKGLWRRYGSYAEAAADWGSYILGPAFADLETLGQLIARYAPWSDGNNPADYGRKAAREIDALPRGSEVGSRESEVESRRSRESSVVSRERSRGGRDVDEAGATEGDLDDPSLPTSDFRPPTQPVIYDIRNDTHAARFGLSPAERDRILGKCYPDRNGRRPEVIVVHVQWGWTAGSLRHWLGTPASATVMVQGDGSILNVIREQDGPWTNGDVANPDAAARALMTRFGRDLNPVSLTIEAEDGRTTAINPAQTHTVLWQIREWQRAYPWLTAERILGHYQIDAVERATCGLYRDEIARLLGATETLPAPPPAPPPFDGLPAWLPAEFFPATFPLADPDGAVTKAVIAWIAANDRLPWFREKIDVAPGKNLWSFDLVTFLNDGPKVWVAG